MTSIVNRKNKHKLYIELRDYQLSLNIFVHHLGCLIHHHKGCLKMLLVNHPQFLQLYVDERFHSVHSFFISGD